MNNILRAVAAALFLAIGAQSAAQAATVDQPTLEGPLVMNGSGNYVPFVGVPEASGTYWFRFTSGPLDPLPSGGMETGSAVTLSRIINGATVWSKVSQSTVVDYLGQMVGYAENAPFRFQLSADEMAGEDLTFRVVLVRFLSGFPTGTIIENGTKGTIFSNDRAVTDFGLFNLAADASSNPTPVPIGGTLPLMLSALGLGAWVMRRRAKGAALA